MINEVSVPIITTGNEFLCAQKKLLTTEKQIFFILGNVSDLESDLCDHMRKIIIFQLAF